MANSVSADEQQYLSADAFIEQSFEGVKPNWKMLTLDSALKSQAKQILGHEYAGSRVRYWQAGTKTVWILEEIGKEKPITLGIAVNQNHIDTIQVLVYRETRGGEVAQASFLQQFKAALLQADNKLNKPIDSIAGATLSVHAVTNASRLALLFSQHVTASN
ncbi:MAG TPA: FMN-binding protein [Pseudomonadales bacterium]|nr:FMN-binding protein [Pseudomonadales bacterium]